MEAIFIFTISTTIINICTALISHGGSGGVGGSSDSSAIIPAIVIPVVVVGLLIVFLPLLIYCKLKRGKAQRMSVLPLSTQMAIAQQENQYAPPSYKQVPPYNQPPPYEQPPAYSTPSAPIESANVWS